MPRSIIDVEVRDAAFKAFTESFGKYQKAVQGLPKDWAKVNAESEKATESYTAAVDELNKAAEAVNHISKNLDGAGKQAGAVDIKFGGIARKAKSIASDIASITWNIGKWAVMGGAFGLATSVGGLFGMGALAGSASNLRRTSQGLGVSPGQLRAAETNYSKYFDVNATLGNVSGAQSDLSKRWIFSALGISPSDVASKSAADLLPDLLPKLAQRFKQFGSTQQGADAAGLTQLVDMQTLRRLASLSPEELKGAGAAYQKDRATLGADDKTLRNWQELQTQLQRAGYALENVFLKGLERLAGPLGKLSNSFEHAVDVFMSSPKVGEWLGKLGDGIERFAKYITTDEFDNNVRSFVDNLGKLANGIAAVLRFLGLWGDKPDFKTDAAGNQQGMANTPGGAATGRPYLSGRNNPGNLRKWGNLPQAGGFAVFPSEDAGLRAMARQLQMYQNRDGLDTVQGIISKYAPANDHNDTAAYIANVMKRTGFAADQHLNLNDPGTLSKLMAAMTKQENSASNYTPRQIENTIKIENATGGSAVISMQQLAH